MLNKSDNGRTRKAVTLAALLFFAVAGAAPFFSID